MDSEAEKISLQLASGQTLTDSRVGLGDVIIGSTAGAAAAVGKAAGVVVAAPVALIDPRTRETFGAHVEDLGQTITGQPTGAAPSGAPPAPAPAPVAAPGATP